MPKPTRKKKGKKGKYDYKAIAKQTREKVKASSERKSSQSGRGVLNADAKFTLFKPSKDEDHSIDIIPFKAGKNQPWDFDKKAIMAEEGEWAYTFEYWQHRGIGPLENETVICSEKTWKEPCPICEHRRELDAEKAFDSEKMGAMLPKQRNFYNVVCYDTSKEEDKGVQLFDASFFYFEKHIKKLATKAVRRKRGSKLKVADSIINFADPGDSGVSVEWSIEGAKSKNDFDTWMGHQLVQRGDYELDSDYIDAALCLDEMIERLTYAEVYKKYYDEDYEGESQEEEDSGKRRRRGRSRDEEYEDEVEEEEESEEESEEEDELSELSRKELKAILKEEEIDFKVFKSTEDDDIREAINEARSSEEEEEEEEEVKPRSRKKRKGGKKKDECPAEGTFGADFEKYEECDNCKVWKKCEDRYQDEFAEEEE